MKNKQKGITLIALVVTIVVLLILAGITIGTLTGENGIIGNSKKAKEQTEIANEKEILEQATTEAMGKGKYGTISKENLKQALEKITGEGKVEIGETDKGFEVGFIESKRYYEIDENGNVGDYQIAVQDPYPGDIKKDSNGNTLDGSEEHPFEINCIEDLVTFSIMTNGGNTELEIESNNFTDKYVVLNRTLNFESTFSYKDNSTTKYGDLNLDGQVEDIKTELTRTDEGCVGFTPINSFAGYFNGKENEIQNIYINRENNAGLVIGYAAKKIENVGVTGNITSTSGNAAGICMGSRMIENCWNKANITANGLAGGICIDVNIKIKNCYNTGNITSKAGNIGGISAGYGETIEDCYNTGTITTEHEWYAGGICAGHGNGTTTIKNCYNTGKIEAPKTGTVGGILGTNGNVIENCYNTGTLQSKGYTGGIVGTHSIEIYNCYNTGNIKGVYTGGIAYKVIRKIVNCYNLGEVTGSIVGGIARNK